jgi:exodeoxyribonuclease-3
MKIYSWNVNGIRAVIAKGALQKFLSEEQPDIVCLQETKAQQSQAEVDLTGYSQYWYSASKAGYSGTAIFSKIEPLHVKYGLPDEFVKQYGVTGDTYGDPTVVGRVIAAEYELFWLVTVYTPNSKGDLSRLELREKQWDPAFLAYCQQLQILKPVFFCGDLNVAYADIDLANPRENIGKHGFTEQERAGFQKILDAGFIDTFRTFHPDENDAYTWWTHWANARARNIGWRIDYILASASLRSWITATAIHPHITGSDHCPVSIELSI